MTEATVIDVSELMGGLKLGRFHIVLVTLCLLTLFVDAMDYSTVVVAAPAILRAWHIDRSAMGIVFGAGNLGLVFGAIVFGRIGDGYGRRVGIIASVLTYALPALATGFSTNVDSLLVLRFLSTLGLGGGVPNAIALLTESAPRRYRASSVIVALIGTSLGAAAAGGLAATVIPQFGWQSVFWIVGFVGLIVAAILYLALDESIPFLALRESDTPRLRRLVQSAAPGLRLAAQTRFVAGSAKRERSSLGALLQGRLRIVTPLLWGAFFIQDLTFTTLVSWSPVLLESGGLTPTGASLAFAYSAMAGIFTRLLLARFLDRFAAIAVAGAAAIAIAAFLVLGTIPLVPTAMIVAMVIATGFSAATRDGLNSIVGTFYPTAVRANGAGWANGAARVAGIVGPIGAGYMLAAKFSFAAMMVGLAVPYLFLLLFCAALTRRARQPHEAVAPS